LHTIGRRSLALTIAHGKWAFDIPPLWNVISSVKGFLEELLSTACPKGQVRARPGPEMQKVIPDTENRMQI
jgi:hypothetical protein